MGDLQSITPATAKLRAAELSGLASPNLRARAREAGVDENTLASLKDAEFDVNSAMISLILRSLEDPNKPLPFTGQRVLARDSRSRTACLSKWSQAVRAGGLSTAEVFFWTIVRLLWHLGPPMLFLYTSLAYSRCVDNGAPESVMSDVGGGAGSSSASVGPGRRSMAMASTPIAAIVCVWWAICIALVLVCVFANPSFLLVDLRESFRDGYFT